MTECELELIRENARRAIKDKDYKLALKNYCELADQDVPDAILMCGVIHENDWDETLTDLDVAFGYYRKLAIKWNADSGYLGCVRIILAKKDVAERDKALDYCRKLIKGEEKRYGYLTMGRV